MKKFCLLYFILFGISRFSFGQLPEDALRNGWYLPNTSARGLSIGGAMCSLGGDISAISVNPAGLGLYKTREFVLTPGFITNSNNNNFRGSGSNSSKVVFNLGTIGAVFGGNASAREKASSTFAVAITQTASFGNHISYSGSNDYSSGSEQYLEQLANDGADYNSALTNYPFGASLAFYTYLIDSLNDGAGNVTGYRSQVPVSTGIVQEYDNKQHGGIYDISFGFASNNSDKLYLGGSIGVPVSTYKSELTYTENDASSDINNNFNYYTYNERFTSTGVGINAKLGLIYRFANHLRLGAAVHTPSFMSFEDKLHSDMTTDTEGLAGVQSASSDEIGGSGVSNYNYTEITPWRALISASYVFDEVENTKLQNGFITADIEYVDYKGSRFYQSGSVDDEGLDDYYNSLNDVIKDYYKGAVNFRLGGELKFAPWAVRLGGAYYGSPYQDGELKANRILAAGGVGYRNSGFFIDLGLGEVFNKDINFPYRLNDKANTFATLKDNQTRLLITAGIKF